MNWNWGDAFVYGPYAVFLVVQFLFVRRLGLRIRHQARWAMWLLFCFSKFLAFKELGGGTFSPEFPDWLIWLWDWAYSGAVILFGLSLVFAFRFPRKAWILPLAAWGLSAWGLWNGVRVPDVMQTELRFENLPASLDGYRIVQLSDLHASSAARQWRTQEIVGRVNALSPDLICLTGDCVDGNVEKSFPFLAPLKDLRAKDGVCACTGNHEHYFNFAEWKTAFYDRFGTIRILMNECAFPRPGLALAGVPDPAGVRDGLPPPDVRNAFAAATNGEFRILLQHQPKWAEENIREVGVDLQLSGHTHGGIAPGICQIVARHNAGYSHGIYRYGKSLLHVSPGCGQWAGFPMRFFNDSEITLITLRR